MRSSTAVNCPGTSYEASKSSIVRELKRAEMPITLLTLLYIQGLVENLRSRRRQQYFQQSGVYVSRFQYYGTEEYGPTRLTKLHRSVLGLKSA